MVKLTMFTQDGINNDYFLKEFIGTDDSISLTQQGDVLPGITCINLCRYKPSAIQEHWHLMKFWTHLDLGSRHRST